MSIRIPEQSNPQAAESLFSIILILSLGLFFTRLKYQKLAFQPKIHLCTYIFLWYVINLLTFSPSYFCDYQVCKWFLFHCPTFSTNKKQNLSWILTPLL